MKNLECIFFYLCIIFFFVYVQVFVVIAFQMFLFYFITKYWFQIVK